MAIKVTITKSISKPKNSAKMAVLHWVQKVSAHLGDQVLDFKLRSFVDPKPVEL